MLVLAVPTRVPLLALIVLIGATGWFGTSRMIRAEVLRLREETFVRAAEALGASRRRLSSGTCWWNTAGPLLVAATLGVGDVILLEAGLLVSRSRRPAADAELGRDDPRCAGRCWSRHRGSASSPAS